MWRLLSLSQFLAAPALHLYKPKILVILNFSLSLTFCISRSYVLFLQNMFRIQTLLTKSLFSLLLTLLTYTLFSTDQPKWFFFTHVKSCHSSAQTILLVLGHSKSLNGVTSSIPHLLTSLPTSNPVNLPLLMLLHSFWLSCYSWNMPSVLRP